MNLPTRVEIPGTPYSYDSRLEESIQQIATRVRRLREGGKLTPEVLSTIRKFFKIKNIYHSNAIEGNSLNVGETRQVVEMGLTLTGKSLKDQAEARNLAHALDFLETLVSNNTAPLLEAEIRQIHQLILKAIDDQNAGKYRMVQVEISGSSYKPPSPTDVPEEMADLSSWLSTISIPGNNFASKDGFVHAAVAHAWLVLIHPFVDGNGRLARLLMNLILMRYGYPIAIISKEDRARYYDALEDSQASDLSSFLGLVSECLTESLEEYEHAVEEHQEQLEWGRAIAEKFTSPQKVKIENEYEVWKSAMDLLKNYFRQTASLLDQAPLGRVYFKDFGIIEYEKYLMLRHGESAKRTWFFRLDFRSGDRSARYLFFFNNPGYLMRPRCDVTVHVAREEAPYHYERLEHITAPNVPNLVEIGYLPREERFLVRRKDNRVAEAKIENFSKLFIEEVVQKHFDS